MRIKPKSNSSALFPFSPFPLFPFAFCLLLSAFCLLSGCGKRRPPLPPVERVPQRTELLSGVQRGNQVILSWPAPRRNAPTDSVQNISRIDVYRLAEAPDDPLPLTEEEFGARATLVGSVPPEEIEAGRDALTYTDTLELNEPVRLRYALRYANAAGQRAAFSNFFLVEPASRVSQPPALSTAVDISESALRIRWQTPAENVDGSRPANLLGYSVYRATGAQNEPAQTPLNSSPLNANEYADQDFQFGEEYVYVVRAVSLGTGGNPVESLNSNAVTVTPRDTFAPAPPSGLSPGPALGSISIFWAANTERDVAGYNIFRSTDPELPKGQWAQINRSPLTRTTFKDDTVRSGTKYFYYLTASDAAGNTSRPSEVISETAP